MMSKERILSLLDPKNQKNSAKIVGSVKIEKTLSILGDFLTNERGEQPVILLQGVFSGLNVDEESYQEKILIIRKICDLADANEIDTKVTNDIIAFLLSELDKFPLKELIDLNDFILENADKGKIKNCKSLELMSKILSITSTLPKICHKDSVMSGADYHCMVIDRICEMKWRKDSILPLVTGMRDMSLKDAALKQVVEKILSKEIFNNIPNEEIPSLIYQVLLLSVKGCKQEVLEGIITYFHNQTEKETTDELTHSFLEDDANSKNDEQDSRSVEGTSLLHVIFAVKQDQSLGREFIKYVKLNAQDNPAKVFSPFTIALALSMTQIHRLEEQLLDFLKSIILKHFKDDEHRLHSKWVNEMFPKRFPLEKNILTAAKKSKSGWDHVTHGLINLAFNLIDSYTPKQSDIFSITSDAITPNQKACQLGAKVIQEVFQSQDAFRGAILQQILDLIIAKSSTNQQHYLDLLSSLVSKVPQIVIDCLPKFREVFDHIPMLNVQTAEGLLRAVLPLMRVSMSIKDSLILVLRKSMFSKNLEARKVAVMGFLLVLKHFKIESENTLSLSSQTSSSQMFSCSQLDLSSQLQFPSAANEALCIEIIGSLRKSLTQHGSVRQLIYQSIYEVICKNPKLSTSALDLLYTQFTKYYQKEEDQIPPLHIDSCVVIRNNEVILNEPLDHLLCALQLCTKKSGKRLDEVLEEDETLSFLLDNIEEAIESLTKRLLKSCLEDFGLDKTVDYQTSTDEGMKNTLLANIIHGVYEVLIEYTYMKEKEIKVEICERVQHLFDKLQELQETISEASSNGKKGKPSQSKVTRHCMLSFKCMTKMLSAVLSDNEVENENALNLLRQSCSLAKYLASGVLQKLQQLNSRRECDGAGGKNMDHLFRQCLVLSRVFLQQINGEGMISVEVLRKSKGKRIGNMCLESLSSIVGYVCNHLPEQIKPLLESLDFHPDVISQNDVTSQGSIIYRVIRRIQRLTIKVITSPDEDLGPKEAIVLITMLSHLSPHLKDSAEVGHVYTWFMRMCVEQVVDDPTLMKTIFTKFLSLHHQCKGSLSIISKVCQDIHSRVGDIDEDIEVEESLNFKIITERNAVPNVFILIAQHIERILDESDLVMTKLKNSINKTDDEAREKQQRICQSLIGIVLSIHELVQSAFTPGACADIITKVSTKVYNILGSLTKFNMAAYSKKKSNVEQKFERLVKLTGTHLSQQIYASISYMQSTQSTEQQSMNTTNKRDKKKTNKAGKSRALKETRCIPNLIFSIEQYERYLIQLSKKTKVDFMGNIKRSTARDFRINAASLEAALHELESDGEDDDNGSAVDVSHQEQEEQQHESSLVSRHHEDLTRDDKEPAPKRKKLSNVSKKR